MKTVRQLFDLSGRTALITGASGYLGSAMSAALAEAGARVIAASRKLDTARKAAASLPGTGHFGIALDHMDERSIERAMKKIGAVDVLVNNGHEAQPADWRTVTGKQFSRQLENATGYFLLARAVRDAAAAAERPASIIMLGSMYGLVGSYPDAYEGIAPASPAAYHALKGGIVHLTRHLAVYWARDGVRVNCLSPGPFPSAKAAPAMVKRLRTKSPMKRMGLPHELKGGVVFLASDASSYVTGHNLVVDGGWTAW
jgi:NAD(P)-dependent dehydrogenase (short-subunit alcohol dehydrogenase family)